MIFRPINLFCALCALIAGLYLYSQKHRTALVARDIETLIDQRQATIERINVLRDDWAKLNDADDLKERADKYLHLQPLSPSHYVKFADMTDRLPAPLPPGAALPPVETASAAPPDGEIVELPSLTITAQTPVMTASTVVVPSAVANAVAEAGANIVLPAAPVTMAATSAPVTAATPALAVANAAHPVQVAKLDTKSAKPKPAHKPVQIARHNDDDDGEPKGAPLPLAAPIDGGASVLSAMAHAGTHYAQPKIVAATAQTTHYVPPPAARVQHAAVPHPAMASQSSLASGGALPPPVPLPDDDR